MEVPHAFEYSLIQGRAQQGYEVLKDIDFPWPVAEVARQHHWSGHWSNGAIGHNPSLGRTTNCADQRPPIHSSRTYRLHRI